MSFIPSSPGSGTDHSEISQIVIANSATIGVGEAVSLDTTTGFLTNAIAAHPIMGIVIGFETASGVPLQPTAYSAGSATSSDVQSYTAASNNQTVAKVVALVETSKSKRWSAAVNGTVSTTVHSDQPGARVDVDSANTNYARVLETTATRTVATCANFFDWGTDPADSTRLIVSIAASQKDSALA